MKRNSVPVSRREKSIGLLAATAALLAIAIPYSGLADGDHVRSHSGRTGGKFEYCTTCHGASGRGYQGFYTMPRLAGQSPEYLVEELLEFAAGHRKPGIPISFAGVHALDPATRSAIASRFSRLNPAPTGRGPSRLMAEGRRIYEQGVPEANIPNCVACHGPQGQGAGAAARVAGQLFRYTRKTLNNWSKERGAEASEASQIMRTVAGNMTRSQIEAVSAYVSSLR